MTLSFELNGKDEYLVLFRAFRYHGPIRASGELRDYAACFVRIRHFKYVSAAHHFSWIRDGFHAGLAAFGLPKLCFYTCFLYLFYRHVLYDEAACNVKDFLIQIVLKREG